MCGKRDDVLRWRTHSNLWNVLSRAQDIPIAIDSLFLATIHRHQYHVRAARCKPVDAVPCHKWGFHVERSLRQYGLLLARWLSTMRHDKLPGGEVNLLFDVLHQKAVSPSGSPRRVYLPQMHSRISPTAREKPYHFAEFPDLISQRGNRFLQRLDDCDRRG